MPAVKRSISACRSRMSPPSRFLRACPTRKCSFFRDDSVPGVYIGLLDKIPFGAAMNKGLTLRMGQTHVPRYTKLLLDKIQSEEIDPSFVITHRLPLTEAPVGRLQDVSR